jgi:hypothetical protein
MKFSSSLREASMLGSSGLFQAVLGVLGVVLTPGLITPRPLTRRAMMHDWMCIQRVRHTTSCHLC